jgi:hypothetical protein
MTDSFDIPVLLSVRVGFVRHALDHLSGTNPSTQCKCSFKNAYLHAYAAGWYRVETEIDKAWSLGEVPG